MHKVLRIFCLRPPSRLQENKSFRNMASYGTNVSTCHVSDTFPVLRANLSLQLSIYIVSSILASVFISSINVFVIYGLLKTNQSGTLSQKLIILLSISDFLVGFLAMPLTIILIWTHTSHRYCEFEEFTQFVNLLFSHFSGMLVSTVALDRYFHIQSLATSNKSTKRKFIVGLVVFNFVVAVTGSFGELMASKYRIGIYHSVTVLPGEMLYLLIGIVSYLMAMREVRKYVKGITDVSDSFPRRDVEMAKTVALILIVVIICYTPGITILGIYEYTSNIARRKPSETLGYVLLWSILLVYLNSAFNSIILISRNAGLKSVAFRLICRSRKQRDGVTASVKHVAVNEIFQKDTDSVSLDINYDTTNLSKS